MKMKLERFIYIQKILKYSKFQRSNDFPKFFSSSNHWFFPDKNQQFHMTILNLNFLSNFTSIETQIIGGWEALK